MKEYDFSEKKLYNGESCHKGMRIVPFVIENRKVAIELGVKDEYIETYKLPGKKKYLVSFTEVPEDKFEDYMSKEYYQQIRDFFDDYGENSYKEKFSRCTIDGKVCPISNICSKCQRKDASGTPLQEKKRGMISLDLALEDGKEPGVESDVEMDILYEELLNALGKLCSYYPTIIKKLRAGYSTAEIIKDLPVKKSKAYMDLKIVEAFANEFLK